MLVEHLKKTDLSDVQALLVELGYQIRKEDFEHIINMYTSNENYCVLCAKTTNKVVGFIALILSDHFFILKKRCRIETLIVSLSHRGKGIGKQLIEAAEKFAKEHNCGVIEVTSRKEIAMEGAEKFYKGLGYDNSGNRQQLYLRKEIFEL